MSKKKVTRKKTARAADADKTSGRRKASPKKGGSRKPPSKKRRRPRPERQTARKGASDGFPTVGIGASAGGLEALEELFDAMPADTGMAFVVVTHQHVGHVSLLPELLGRETQMPVVEATDGTKLQPNRVYVGPPGAQLAILNATLHLVETGKKTAPQLPIDYFFRSLAEDQKERAICVVLSGTGTDGTIGLKAVKGESGMAMVQQPQSAKYAGMPSSAMATGLADYVLQPAAMPRQLLAYVRGPYLKARPPSAAAPGVPAEPLQKILLLLRDRTGHDFTAYKESTIRRRIERRMNVHQIKRPNEYVRYLQENPHELDVLFKELLISVTNFFRDPPAWKALAGPLKKLLKSRPQSYTFRAWVPGCATGEEAFSVAILLRECMEKVKRRVDVQVFGTDLDGEAIETARTGQYPDGIAVDVSPERLDRFFLREDSTYRIRKEIREMVIFAPQNVIKDPPFTRLDLISCRNLLIYLNTDLQKKLLPIFHYALKPDGLLFLGPSETVGSFTDLFETLDKRWKVFRRKESARAIHGLPEMPAQPVAADREQAVPAAPPSPAQETHVSRMIERMLLGRFAPASIVVNERGEIVYIHGRTGAYLEPVQGQPRNNILEMAREGLQIVLASALRQCVAKSVDVAREQVRVKANGEFVHADLAVTRLQEPEALRGLLLVTIRPTPPPPQESPKTAKRKRREAGDNERVSRLERELQYIKESHQRTLEELETSNEELKSTNEELQSTNEELQSTNEELEMSKEELQSLNEELTTLNAELQSKVDDLSQANDDMQNLLNSTGIATVFLDNELNIKRYTERAKALFNVIQTDIGRPLGDLVSNLRYEGLIDDCRNVLDTLVFKEAEVQSSNGSWYLMRIMPYRTSENVIDGLVLTSVNIDDLKLAQHEALSYFEGIVGCNRTSALLTGEQSGGVRWGLLLLEIVPVG